jgi:selenocysteine lyase/cysteine desulfurase
MPRPLLIKLGGELLEDRARLATVVESVREVSRHEPVVIVHGGGKEIDSALRASGIEKRQVDGLRIIGNAPDKAAVTSFLVEGAHAHDLATLLDLEGVAVRSGHHCAHPLMAFYGVPATCRASVAFYNTHDEIDAFVVALRKVRRLLG